MRPSPTASTCATYADAYAPVRNQRCRYFLTILYGFSFLFSAVFQARINTLTSLFSWKTIVYSFILFLSLLFIFVARLTSSTVYEPILPSTAAEIVSYVYKKHNWYMAGMYVLSSLVIVRSYFGYLTNETYTSTLITHLQGPLFDARQLNAEYIFIHFYAIVLGASFAVKRVIEKKNVLTLPSVQVRHCTAPICFFAIKASVIHIVCAGARWAWHVFKYTYLFFLLFNSSVVYYYAARFFGMFTKVLDTPLVAFRWLDLYLFFRMILAGCLTTCSWELVDRLFDILFAVATSVTEPYTNQFDCLVSGLQLKKTNLMRALAYAELAYFSSKDVNRRNAMFRSTNGEIDRSAWSRISSECMNTVDMLRKSIELEFSETQRTPETAQAAKTTTPSPFPNVDLVYKDVFASPEESISALDDRTCSLFTNASTLSMVDTMWVSTDSQSSTFILPPSDSQRLSFTNIITHVELWKQLNTPTLVRKTRSLFVDFPVVIWAIQALGNLTAASFNEDLYGLVQRDIGTVLDCLLGCLLQVEELVQSPPLSYRQLAPGFHGRAILNEPHAVLMALRKAIYEITVTFKDYPERFKVQKKHEAKLRRFVDIKE